MPLLTPFGTMGAVIVMRDRIKSKNALLDIGASGPIAGMLVAIPVILYGLAHSEVIPLDPVRSSGRATAFFTGLLKRIAVGPIPEGSDVSHGPMAFAGWTGLFVTMLNLLPVGQLDGGHVAYALFGPRQNTYSQDRSAGALLLLVPINFVWHIVPVASRRFRMIELGGMRPSRRRSVARLVRRSHVARAALGRRSPADRARRALARAPRDRDRHARSSSCCSSCPPRWMSILKT